MTNLCYMFCELVIKILNILCSMGDWKIIGYCVSDYLCYIFLFIESEQ